MGTILLFNADKNKRSQIVKAAKSLGHTVRSVSRSDYNKPLGALVGVGTPNVRTAYTGAELKSEMMVFSGLNSDQLDAFLDIYKKTEIAPIDLKAVVTPTNIYWTPVQLYQELTKEHNRLK